MTRATPVSLTVNGEPAQIHVRPRRTLLEALRLDLNLTGTKLCCDTGDCGACTVLVDGEPVTACLVLSVEAEGREVVTVEGLSAQAGGRELVNAFASCGAVQCGYCTPGMVVASWALLRDNPSPSETEIRQALAGNLCRCTGYEGIVRAVARAAARERPHG